MITVLVCFYVWGSDAKSTYTLERLREVLQAKTDDRDELFFDWFAYFENNYLRFKIKNSTVPCMCVCWCNYGHNSWVTYAKMSILIGTSFTIISIMPVTNHGVGLCWCPWGDKARGVQLSLWLPQWVLGSLENGCSRGQLIFAKGLALVQPQGRRSSVTPGALIRLVILVLRYVFYWGHEVTALL